MPLVIAFVEDLLFLSRIRETARAAGVDVKSVRTVEALVEAARTAAAGLVLVDADSDRIDGAGAIAALRREPALAALEVVAFFSHVQANRARAVLAAGATRALARSAFVAELPRLLATEAPTSTKETP
jgi:CheY-like chemotaxis protein